MFSNLLRHGVGQWSTQLPRFCLSFFCLLSDIFDKYRGLAVRYLDLV